MAHQPLPAASVGKFSMSRLFTGTGAIRQPSDRDLIDLPPSNREVSLYMARNSQERNQISYSCLDLCNIESGSTNHQIGAYYISALIGLFPGLRTVAEDMYQTLGIKANVFVGIEQCQENGLELIDEINSRKLLVYLAQVTLILYKNVNVQGYNAYMRTRHGALCAFAGYAREKNDDIREIAIDMETAAVVRTVLLAHHPLRVYILNAILHNQSQSTGIGKVMGYLAGILEWTEMESFKLICDTLLLPRSPAIFDRDVAMEVIYLTEAYKAITSVDQPPYFRIMYPYSATRIMERSRFPILLAVAQQLRAKKYDTVRQFVATSTAENPVVKRLIDIHEAGMASPSGPILTSR